MKHALGLICALTFGCQTPVENKSSSTSDDAGNDAGNATTDAGTNTGDGGDATDASTPFECPPGMNDAGTIDDGGLLMPFSVGRRWTYRATKLGSGGTCSPGIHDWTVDGIDLSGGRTAYNTNSWCDGAGTETFYQDGDKVELRDTGGGIVLDVPVEDGHTWTSSTTTFVWRDAGTVTVPVGTFNDCWKRVRSMNDKDVEERTFCRGVGEVHEYSKDEFGDGWEAFMVCKNF